MSPLYELWVIPSGKVAKKQSGLTESERASFNNVPHVPECTLGFDCRTVTLTDLKVRKWVHLDIRIVLI